MPLSLLARALFGVDISDACMGFWGELKRRGSALGARSERL
jgi:hypothetical protein